MRKLVIVTYVLRGLGFVLVLLSLSVQMRLKRYASILKSFVQLLKNAKLDFGSLLQTLKMHGMSI